MEVKVCELKDLETVYDLVCNLKGEQLERKGFQKAYESKVGKGENHLILAVDEGAAVGFLSLSVSFHLHHAGKVATVEELIVTENSRGKGVGKMLMSSATEFAKEKKCEIIELASGFKRVDAHGFYEKIGFLKRGYNFEMALR